jgi:hypothetical protein
MALSQHLPGKTQKNQETSPDRITDLREDISTRDLCALSGSENSVLRS